MIRIVITAMLGMAALSGPALAQSEPTIDAPYLSGRWATGAVGACDDAAAESLSFNADGTFDAVHLGRSTATGFWTITPERLDLDLLSAPDGDERTFGIAMPGSTRFRIMALLFDAEPDAVRMVAVLGDQMRGADLVRCR